MAGGRRAGQGVCPRVSRMARLLTHSLRAFQRVFGKTPVWPGGCFCWGSRHFAQAFQLPFRISHRLLWE